MKIIPIAIITVLIIVGCSNGNTVKNTEPNAVTDTTKLKSQRYLHEKNMKILPSILRKIGIALIPLQSPKHYLKKEKYIPIFTHLVGIYILMVLYGKTTISQCYGASHTFHIRLNQKLEAIKVFINGKLQL